MKFIHLTAFLEVLQNDPDLSCIPAVRIPQIFLSLYVSTGCDYTSLFSETGIASFYPCLFQDQEFITSGNSIFSGSLAETKLHDNQFGNWLFGNFEINWFSLFRKHKSAFSHSNPKSHYRTFQKPEQTHLECCIQ